MLTRLFKQAQSTRHTHISDECRKLCSTIPHILKESHRDVNVEMRMEYFIELRTLIFNERADLLELLVAIKWNLSLYRFYQITIFFSIRLSLAVN